jgi:hypothetical protein
MTTLLGGGPLVRRLLERTEKPIVVVVRPHLVTRLLLQRLILPFVRPYGSLRLTSASEAIYCR